MRIESSHIQLSSAHLFKSQSTVQEQFQVRVKPVAQDDAFQSNAESLNHDIHLLTKLLRRYFHLTEKGQDTDRLAHRIDRLASRIRAEQAAADAGAQAPQVKVSVSYQRTDSYREVEATSFQAQGSVTTKDGLQIDFSQALDLARVYARTETTSFQAKAVLTGPAAAVASGSPTAAPPIPAESPNQQALALAGGVLGVDRNGDGSINGSRELIGRSGDGFSELRQFDDDGNGFIDEGDAVFSKLRVVSGGTDGVATKSLADQGVGAIFLGSVATPFTARDAAGQVTAQLSRSGVYLNENGTTGIAQQVNILA